MNAALPAPALGDLFLRWSPQPIAITAALAALLGYGWSWRQLRPAVGRTEWPKKRIVAFSLGIVVFLWTTCGLPQVYASSLYWMWSSQLLTLLLIVPVIVMAGQPVELARRAHGGRAWAVRFVASPAGRLFANPLVGPVLIPALSVVLFFGPVAGCAIGRGPADAIFAGILPVLVVTAGALIVLPLVSVDDDRGSMAVGLALTIGVFELLLDAIPGISLRLHTTLVTTYFDHRVHRSWAPTALHDQQLGGAVLWCVSEVIDLPFLILIYVRWLRADARDAAEIDTVLEAERIAQGRSVAGSAEPGSTESGSAELRPATDQPWWLSDPSMRERYRR